jgi:hypothetical protein
MIGRRIKTQAEADALNAFAEQVGLNHNGQPVRFTVSTDEHAWAELCGLWPRVAELMRYGMNA